MMESSAMWDMGLGYHYFVGRPLSSLSRQKPPVRCPPPFGLKRDGKGGLPVAARSVVIAQLSDFQLLCDTTAHDPIYHPIFLGYAPRPPS